MSLQSTSSLRGATPSFRPQRPCFGYRNPLPGTAITSPHSTSPTVRKRRIMHGASWVCGRRNTEFEICGRRSEEHTSELQSRLHLVCRLLLEKKKRNDL